MRFSSLSSASTRPLFFSLAAAATVASTAVRFFSIPPQVVALPPAAAAANSHNSSNMLHNDAVDPEYPGTAVARMLAARARVSSFTEQELTADWDTVRKKILWAGGLKDLPHARPGPPPQAARRNSKSRTRIITEATKSRPTNLEEFLRRDQSVQTQP